MAEKTFRGRVVVGGAVSAKALVSHGGFNTLASYQQPLILKNVKAPCSDQNHRLYHGWHGPHVRVRYGRRSGLYALL